MHTALLILGATLGVLIGIVVWALLTNDWSK